MGTADRRLEPRKQPRQVRASLTRRRILDAAAHVFAEHGYAAGTTNRIAERARVSIGSLYQYFPNKDAILVELLIRHLDDGVAAQAGLHGGPLEVVLRAMARASIGNHRADPRLLRLMIEEAPRSPELLRRVAEYQRTRFATVRDLLERHPEVRVADVDTAARLVVSTVELVVHHLVADPDPVDGRRLEDELVAMLGRYLAS